MQDINDSTPTRLYLAEIHLGVVDRASVALIKCLPYSLKFSRIKYFVVLPNSAQKQISADKIFVV